MKFKIIVLSCLISAVVLSVGYEYGRAESEAQKSPLNIGVVSMRKIFQGSKRYIKHSEEAAAEEKKVTDKLKKLSKEIDADRGGLDTLKVGSSDYLALVKEILVKQAGLQAQQEFHKQELALKDRRWTEEFYKDILRLTGDVAEQKGLDLVFENSEVELPAASASELMLTIRTHKLLYSGRCLDITDEVMVRLDTGK